MKLSDLVDFAETVRVLWDDKSASEVIVNDYIAKFFRNTATRKKGNGNVPPNNEKEDSTGGQRNNVENNLEDWLDSDGHASDN